LLFRRERSAFAGTEEYLFKHAVLRDVTYETVLLKLRRRYHAQVGAWLEGHAAERLDEYLDLIAGHYERAGEAKKAILYLLMAGNRAGLQYANPEAIGHYRRALALLEKTSFRDFEMDSGREIAAQLQEGLGDVLARIGQHPEARDTFERALAQVPEGDRIWQARLHHKIGNVWQSMGQYQGGLQAYDLAETTLGPKPDEPSVEWWQEWIEIQNQRMALYYWPGKWHAMAEIADTTRPALAQYGTAMQRARFYSSLLRMLFRRDRYVVSEEALASAQAALAASLESHDPVEIAAGRFGLAIAYLLSGDLDGAEPELQASLSLAERSGDAALVAQCLNWQTIISRQRGRVEETRQWISRSLEAATAASLPMYAANAKANLAWVA
jgi:predicted ATPase